MYVLYANKNLRTPYIVYSIFNKVEPQAKLEQEIAGN